VRGGKCRRLSDYQSQSTATAAMMVGGIFVCSGLTGWWRGTVVERRSLAGELSLSCALPAADG